MSSLQRDAKIYGAVESESYITFTGFCKKIYDTTHQSVEVFLDDKKIATLLANEKIADIEDKYEVFDTNGFCFTYQLPKEYIGQKHKLEFKTQNGEQLLHSPTHTIDKFSPLYNQAMFIESLNKSTQYNFGKEGYTKNALSFIAIEENLNDGDFIEFVLEMCKLHKQLSLSVFYFNEHQKNQATKLLSQIKNKQFINPSSIEEIVKSSEIYLHNVVEEFRFTINEEYYDKVKKQSVIKENLFILELTRKAKKKKDMGEIVVDSVTPILFETSVVSEMLKNHERYNAFNFVNSLYQPIDKEKIKDMYCPNSIGFLATQENLEDEEFVKYINTLSSKINNVKFIAFIYKENEFHYIDKIGFAESYIINNFELIPEKCQILICNHPYDIGLFKRTIVSTNNIYAVNFNANLIDLDVFDNSIDQLEIDKACKNNFIYDKKILRISKFNKQKYLNNIMQSILNGSTIDSFESIDTLYDIYVNRIKNFIENKEVQKIFLLAQRY